MTAVSTPRIATVAIIAAAACAALVAAAPAQASQFDLHDPLCRTPDGRAPMVMNDPASLHRAYAAMRGGRPVVVFNPNKMTDLQPITRIWVYYHECGHHALGHTSGNRAVTRENDADCWAIRAMRYRGILTRERYRVILADMHRVYRRGGDVHLPGHLRAEHLDQCLRTTGGYGKIRNAKFTPQILKRQMAMRHGQGNPDPNGLGQPPASYGPQTHGRRGEPERQNTPYGGDRFSERRQLEEN